MYVMRLLFVLLCFVRSFVVRLVLFGCGKAVTHDEASSHQHGKWTVWYENESKSCRANMEQAYSLTMYMIHVIIHARHSIKGPYTNFPEFHP